MVLQFIVLTSLPKANLYLTFEPASNLSLKPTLITAVPSIFNIENLLVDDVGAAPKSNLAPEPIAPAVVKEKPPKNDVASLVIALFPVHILAIWPSAGAGNNE
ncbi:hypothetical protein D3C85_1045610 [compost metagenome]